MNEVQIIEYSPDYFSQVHNLYLATYREIALTIPEVQTYIRKSIKSTFASNSYGICDVLLSTRIEKARKQSIMACYQFL